ncbi:MAG: hypothetical protein ACLQNG_12255 [Acidimicrobiales bacterium]|jgi:hypothetical protein
MTRTARRHRVALAVTVLSVVLAGCSAGGAGTTTQPSTTLAITTTTVHYVPQYVSVGGHQVLVPTENDHVPISSATGIGQNVIITASGFEPAKLYAASGVPIVFTNLTDVTQVVHFHDFPTIDNSKPISPGGSWSFHYGAVVNVVYGSRAGSSLGLLYIGSCPPNCG